jgi:hypothetical protein
MSRKGQPQPPKIIFAAWQIQFTNFSQNSPEPAWEPIPGIGLPKKQ